MTPPTGTVDVFKDSPSINFSNGNPWKEVGTWPADPALTTGPLSALSDLHIFGGLKNSDDQGTYFDILAELYKNGTTLVTSGLTRCVQGITRNPSLAKEVTFPFGSFSPVVFDGTSDQLVLKLWTRIGTNADGTKCAGSHSNAVGLRVYFSSQTKPSKFSGTLGAANQGPTSRPGGPYQGPVGQPVAFDGAASSDPENDPLTFSWDFGDTTTGTGATPAHSYATSGTYTVSLTVSDPQGSSHTAATVARVLTPLTTARAWHAATLLKDGTVLLTGGTGPGGVLNTAERYDLVTLSATALPTNLTTPRTEHSANLLAQGDTILIAGQDSLGLLFTTELFNPGTQAFRAIAPNVQILRSGHTATGLLDGRVLIAGGQSSGALSSVEGFNAQSAVLFQPSYNPEQGTFTVLPNGLGTPRWDHSATLLPDGRILITGGRNDTGVLSTVEVFDPATEQFTALTAQLTTPRAGHSTTLLPDGRVLLLGGENAGGLLASAEVFDPATGTFTALTPGLSTPRANHAAVLLPTGVVLVTGGQGNSGMLASTEVVVPTPADTTAPVVNQMSPANGATGVDRTEILGVRFSEPIDVRTLTATSVTLSGGSPVPATLSAGEQGLLLFVVPNAPLAAGTTYTLSLTADIKDTTGHPLTAFSSTFTTVAAPTITGFTPASGSPGTAVTITGTNFDPIASQNDVQFNGVLATVTAASASSLTAAVPGGRDDWPDRRHHARRDRDQRDRVHGSPTSPAASDQQLHAGGWAPRHVRDHYRHQL